ncbi:MAG: CBS domain-containing protein [Candidatus Aenigmarchaeota archaeon]|nr:CBS domain-containing protein [Candidatus Aenigmarchaeota archaeon]
MTGKYGVKVSSVMNKDPVTIDVRGTLKETADIMMDRGVGSILVMDRNVLKGIMTERDMVRELGQRCRDPKTTEVGKVMTTNLFTVNPDLDIREAASQMLQRDIRRLPVIDAKGSMIGIITERDILRATHGSSMFW